MFHHILINDSITNIQSWRKLKAFVIRRVKFSETFLFIASKDHRHLSKADRREPRREKPVQPFEASNLK